MVLKVEDEDYIFIRRALSVKARPRKETLESDHNFLEHSRHVSVQQAYEESRESRRRQKIIFKKLLFFNSKRMLEVLGCKPGELERKKLQQAVGDEAAQLQEAGKDD
jgi:hypothetical protein